MTNLASKEIDKHNSSECLHLPVFGGPLWLGNQTWVCSAGLVPQMPCPNWLCPPPPLRFSSPPYPSRLCPLQDVFFQPHWLLCALQQSPVVCGNLHRKRSLCSDIHRQISAILVSPGPEPIPRLLQASGNCPLPLLAHGCVLPCPLLLLPVGSLTCAMA